ncbi:MAG: TonB-dependent receptor plug domain-containing protein [Lentisphaeria bacterium]|jgi:outer membrane cobalamin receptor|nr:TonB-dependent receptor plug domain-containing protein [Lentisphaeria bacterium]
MKLRVLLGCALVWTLPMLAADADGETAEDLGTVEVRAKPLADPVVEPMTPARSQELTTFVIGKEEIELSRPRAATDILTYSPSFELRRQGRKNPLSLSLRGSGNTTVLFDGIRLGSKSDTRFIDFLPAALVDEVRIIRDSTGLLYGPPELTSPGGMMGYGGVVDFRFLDPPKEGHHGEMRAEYGRFNQNLQHLHLAGAFTDTLGYVVSADRNATSGRDGENMAHEFTHFFGRLVWRYWDQSRLTLSVLRENGWRENQTAGSGTRYTGWIDGFDPWRATIATLEINHFWTDDISTQVQLFFRDLDATYEKDEPVAQFERHSIRERKKGVTVRQTIRFPESNVLRFGGSLAHLDNPTGKLYFTNMELREREYSLFAQDEWEVLPNRLTLDGGVRWDRTYLKNGVLGNGPGFVLPASGAPAAIEDTWEKPNLSWSVGASLRLTERQSATARFAVAQQSAGSRFLVRSGKPAIEDTEEQRAELGYRFRMDPRFDFTVTGFWSSVGNGLLYDGRDKAGNSYWANADFERLGVELVAEGKLTETLGYFANFLWTHARVEPANGDESRDDAIPRWQAGAGLRYAEGAWRGSCALKYTNEYQSFFGTVPYGTLYDLGDYWLMDANVAYLIPTVSGIEYEIYGGVRNGFNERYETVPGFPDPGAILYAGVAVRW